MTHTLSQSDIVFGAYESVSFPKLNIDKVIAKIDTGADSGAIHCVSIKEVREKGKKTILRFVPMHNDNIVIETDDYVRAFVRGATGHRMRRFVIHTTVVFEGKKYSIRIGLSNRSDMKYDVLIGRRFLAENHILVDVTKNAELEINTGDAL